ncbi:cullin-associated NEDD8-dissociated protein 1 [Lates japonicus]|uniref:Cullin-associated NEDD8-dissociated protein 1 n=1 Tax=Lates japonicus TaxID=270547 RepID=A0AAD3M6B0_LATJO|nr:cullin-associated NEDD8-dissociated protein 1 [Lates japonicus]
MGSDVLTAVLSVQVMGPSKHTVTAGWTLREGCARVHVYFALTAAWTDLDISPSNHLEDGLKDHYDIKFSVIVVFLDADALMLGQTVAPVPVLFAETGPLVEPLRATCTTKVKANSVKQEFEKQDELKRSAMRAVVALLTIPEAEKSPLMSEFQSQISSNQELAAIFDSIQRDSSSANMESMDTS